MSQTAPEDGPNEFVRVVTVRQLNRDTSRIFEEVATKGLTLLVTRHGIPVATIHPPPSLPCAPNLCPRSDVGRARRTVA